MTKWEIDLYTSVGETFKEFLIITAKSYGLEDSNLLKQIDYKIINNGIQIIYPEYLIYVEKGRPKGSGRGTWVPILVLIKWMKKKRIAPGQENRVAYAIQRKIYKVGINGYKGKPFFSEALDMTENETTNLLSVSFTDLVSGLF